MTENTTKNADNNQDSFSVLKTRKSKKSNNISSSKTKTSAGKEAKSLASEDSKIKSKDLSNKSTSKTASNKVKDPRTFENDLTLSTIKWRRRALICASLLGMCALIVIFGAVLNFLAVPVSIILWTVVIVFLLRGVVNSLEKRGLKRVFATTIAYIIMFVVLAIICLFMFSPAFGLGEQVREIIESMPFYINKVLEWAKDIYNQYGEILQNDTVQKWLNDAMSGLSNAGTSIASAGASGVIAAGGAIGNIFMAIGIALVIAFWILMELPLIGKEASRFIKPQYKEDADMWHYTFTHVMAGYIKGTFLQCFIIGVAAGILFWILGIPNSAALGCITGVLNIIPIIGPWIGGAIACIGGIFTNLWVAITALVGTIAIQQFVYTFISPKIMSNSVDIHPALSLFALTVGGAIGGAMSGLIGALVGMLLSIPAVAVFKALFVYYYEKRTGIRIVSEEGVFFKGTPKDKNKAHPMDDLVAEDSRLGKKRKKFWILQESMKKKNVSAGENNEENTGKDLNSAADSKNKTADMDTDITADSNKIIDKNSSKNLDSASDSNSNIAEKSKNIATDNNSKSSTADKGK